MAGRLDAGTQSLLLVTAAEETGDLAVVLRAAGILGAPSGPWTVPNAQVYSESTTTRSTFGIRWSAPRSTSTPRSPLDGKPTRRWRPS